MQRLMHIYVNKIRPIYVEEVEEALFVKDDGHAFREGTIGRRVTEFWAKSGVRRNERLSHTSMRKYIATKTYEQAPEEAPTVQRVLGHSDKTFKRAYVRQECTRTGAEGLAVIAKVTSATDISQKKAPKKQPSPEPSSSKDQSSSPEKASSECAASTNVIPPSEQVRDQDSSNSKKLTDIEKAEAKALFAEDISQGVKLHLKDARARMCTRKALRSRALTNLGSKQVVNFINYIIEKQPVVPPESLPVVSKQARVMEFTTFEDDYSSTVYSARRQNWTDEDTALISEAFAEYVKCPSKDTIKQKFMASEALYRIMHEETFNRCYEKVKNIFKARRR